MDLDRVVYEFDFEDDFEDDELDDGFEPEPEDESVIHLSARQARSLGIEAVDIEA